MNVMLVSTEQGQRGSKSSACYKCRHRRSIPFDYHSRCGHPHLADLAVEGDAAGAAGGWFNWPANFDPLWLRECDGFADADNKRHEVE